MEPFRYHVFICDQRKPEGIPCCAERGSAATIDALRKEVTARGLTDEVQITLCGSLGLCERGPNLVVYPEGVWYSGVLPDDLNQMLRAYLESRAMLTALELDIFTAVGAGSTCDEVARKVSTKPRAT